MSDISLDFLTTQLDALKTQQQNVIQQAQAAAQQAQQLGAKAQEVQGAIKLTEFLIEKMKAEAVATKEDATAVPPSEEVTDAAVGS